MTTLRVGLAAVLLGTLVAACTATSAPTADGSPASDVALPDPSIAPAPASTATPTASPAPSPTPSAATTPEPVAAATEPPSWYRQRRLELTATGFPAPQPVPPEYVLRSIVTVDHLPPPPDDDFVATVGPVPDAIVPISTWHEGCPTTLDELRYVTVSYWGFDERHHTGDLILHRDVAEDLVWVFEQLHAARFPIEQVGLLDDEDFTEFHRKGDDNLTAAYQCRASTGSSRWSQHAYGRAIDINPFHNPYFKRTDDGDVLLPAYAGSYLDREDVRPGMIVEGDVVVAAFDAIGWGWGGRWRTLDDWQHFSANGN